MWQIKHDLNAADQESDQQMQTRYNEGITTVTEAYRELKEFFPGHTLNQRYIKFRVPVSVEFLQLVAKQMYKRDLTEEEIKLLPTSVYVAAMVQEKSKVMVSGEYDGLFKAGYLVKDPNFSQLAPPFLFPQPDFVDPDASLDDVNKESRESAVYKDFLTKAVAYTNATGRILDIAGTDNVISRETKSGDFTYTLVDALYPVYDEKYLQALRDYVENGLRPDAPYSLEDMKKHASMVGNTVDYIYKINKSAKFYGVEDSINVFADYGAEQQQRALELLCKTINLWD